MQDWLCLQSQQKALANLPGIAQSSKYAEMSQTVSRGKVEALSAPTEPHTGMIGSVKFIGEISQPPSVPHGIGESSKSPPTAPKLSENAAPIAASISTSQLNTATKAECPSELRLILEAEERRAAATAANLALCCAVIPSVEATLLTLTNELNKLFVDSMRVYLRAAFAQTRPWARPLRHQSSLLTRRTLSQGLLSGTEDRGYWVTMVAMGYKLSNRVIGGGPYET
ncbi:EKA-like protein [Blumeria hordei DH14]|uniref:EKA-like protein n=1 Tax=Blumeria graminis f. sp. hordei (strain DH14) TaxID=546991 RepID=N1JAR8_BLUG1|nr:EKA-like protein [Blumeria hordei DH14]